MPDGMYDVIVLLGLKEGVADLVSPGEREREVYLLVFRKPYTASVIVSGVAYQANHNKHATKWQIKRQVFLRWI